VDATPAGAPTEAREVHFDHAGEPSTLYAQLSTQADWKELATTGRKFSLTYTQRPFGRVEIEKASLSRPDAASYRVHAERLRFGARTWTDVTFDLHQEGEQLTLRPVNVAGLLPLTITYTTGPSAGLFAFSLPHQLAQPALRYYDSPLIAETESPRLLGSLSLVVPHATAEAVRGRAELVIDDWETPAWPDAPALLGKTLSVGANIEASPDGSDWELRNVQVSGLLFTLQGEGRVAWGASPSVKLEASGERSCEQLRSHLGPSSYLDQVTRFMSGASAKQSAKPGTRDKVQLRLSVVIAPTRAQPAATWQLSGGCGLPKL
jgi:hypothetical protein